MPAEFIDRRLGLRCAVRTVCAERIDLSLDSDARDDRCVASATTTTGGRKVNSPPVISSFVSWSGSLNMLNRSADRFFSRLRKYRVTPRAITSGIATPKPTPATWPEVYHPSPALGVVVTVAVEPAAFAEAAANAGPTRSSI